ncbi:FAD-dependent monooxygenase [Bradyrhizobium semiaridum]|uniref:FAD-dependent monooxygenase n=1 Tax=Bradyrhizobium semiaridum TaxID=2821404 RepID=UPI001CE2DC14|nr:FAD-dependent monooxygenase [Bradyrhizobium semiaridum]
MSAQCKPRVLIAGAGIGGLVAGLSLLQRDIEVEIFEQASELRELGAGVQLSSNGTRVLIALGLEAEMQAIACEPSGKEIRLYSTGRTWKLFDLGASSREIYGAPYWMVHRGDFHRVLVDAFNARAPGKLHLGSRCTGFDEDRGGIWLRLGDGERLHGDAVVGADGVHSEIRRQIGGDMKPYFTGVAAWRGLVPMARLPVPLQRDVGTNWIGPGGHVITYPVRRGELLNFVGIFEGQSWSVESWTERGTREPAAQRSPGGIRQSTPSSKTSMCPTNGRCSDAIRSITSLRGAPACSATLRIRRCRSSRKAPTWRSRTAWYWHAASKPSHLMRPCSAIRRRG